MALQPALPSLAQFLNSILTPKQMNELIALLNTEDALDPEAAPSKPTMPVSVEELLKEMDAVYSLDKFPAPTPEESRRVRDSYPNFIERLAAFQGRHLVKQLRERLHSQ